MNVRYINPFVVAAAEVLKSEANLDVQRGALTLHTSACTADDITVIISVLEQVRGVVLYGISEKTALRIVSNIMGQPFEELDSLAQSGVAELGNVITGRAASILAEEGCEASISPPVLIIGKGTLVSTLDFQRLVVPIVTEAGNIQIHVALTEAPTDNPAANPVPVLAETQL